MIDGIGGNTYRTGRAYSVEPYSNRGRPTPPSTAGAIEKLDDLPVALMPRAVIPVVRLSGDRLKITFTRCGPWPQNPFVTIDRVATSGTYLGRAASMRMGNLIKISLNIWETHCHQCVYGRTVLLRVAGFH
jgi:hypothetical protein